VRELIAQFADRLVAFGIGGAHTVIVVREPVSGRPHSSQYRVRGGHHTSDHGRPAVPRRG